MFSKKLTLVVLMTLALNCQATEKKPSASWYSIKTYDAHKMIMDGKIRIEKPSEFLKKSCAKTDLVYTIEAEKRLRDSFSDEQIRVHILDGEAGRDGKISNVTITIENSYQEWVGYTQKRYYYKWSEEKFFRNYSDCTKEKKDFELWLKSQNDIYKKSNSKYE